MPTTPPAIPRVLFTPLALSLEGSLDRPFSLISGRFRAGRKGPSPSKQTAYKY